MFNLPAPPQFRGLDPDKPLTMYERHLPHWRQEGATYFVTFRLADSLPEAKQQYLARFRDEWSRTHPPPRNESDLDAHAREVFRQIEIWLDEGHGKCHFRHSHLAEILAKALLHFQGVRHFTSCWVIMPNHCHMVIRPMGEWSLETILQGMKGTVARRVNQLIGDKGTLWQDESYDRIVRDEEHLWRIVQYIGRNPHQARLPTNQWHRWLDPSWESAGWRFIDQ
jgi:putative transposase